MAAAGPDLVSSRLTAPASWGAFQDPSAVPAVGGAGLVGQAGGTSVGEGARAPIRSEGRMAPPGTTAADLHGNEMASAAAAPNEGRMPGAAEGRMPGTTGARTQGPSEGRMPGPTEGRMPGPTDGRMPDRFVGGNGYPGAPAAASIGQGPMPGPSEGRMPVGRIDGRVPGAFEGRMPGMYPEHGSRAFVDGGGHAVGPATSSIAQGPMPPSMATGAPQGLPPGAAPGWQMLRPPTAGYPHMFSGAPPLGGPPMFGGIPGGGGSGVPPPSVGPTAFGGAVRPPPLPAGGGLFGQGRSEGVLPPPAAPRAPSNPPGLSGAPMLDPAGGLSSAPIPDAAGAGRHHTAGARHAPPHSRAASGLSGAGRLPPAAPGAAEPRVEGHPRGRVDDERRSEAEDDRYHSGSGPPPPVHGAPPPPHGAAGGPPPASPIHVDMGVGGDDLDDHMPPDAADDLGGRMEPPAAGQDFGAGSPPPSLPRDALVATPVAGEHPVMVDGAMQTTPPPVDALVQRRAPRKRTAGEALNKPPRPQPFTLVEFPLERWQSEPSSKCAERCTSRPVRRRVRPLEHWKNEAVVYERQPGSQLPTVAAIVVAKPKLPGDEAHRRLSLESLPLPSPIRDESISPPEKVHTRLSITSGPASLPASPQTDGEADDATFQATDVSPAHSTPPQTRAPAKRLQPAPAQPAPAAGRRLSAGRAGGRSRRASGAGRGRGSSEAGRGRADARSRSPPCVGGRPSLPKAGPPKRLAPASPGRPRPSAKRSSSDSGSVARQLDFAPETTKRSSSEPRFKAELSHAVSPVSVAGSDDTISLEFF
eukprot:gnl/TRDRNA2_/TRDRNA2_174266_c5_seq11.p1 gnl/TRDRNA2_/TRDRNA2_174266_c5~~gnl/TRDRNA2_/TRDRNA2_174266_c5_seq11.p1  ORF type:complete len:951 (-),score=143.04 gnl/TRDRNA2_/TRDRNA2_174266_c5_seq11:946-3378(-)